MRLLGYVAAVFWACVMAPVGALIGAAQGGYAMWSSVYRNFRPDPRGKA